MNISDSEIQSVKQRFGIIGASPILNNAVRVAMQVAPTDMSVLITGESGSGKESFSKIIHNLSSRKHGQFIAINCGSIPEGTIDSELFGHEKGSFTGAHEARKGYFEVTNGGTIFLDEIGEMPLGTQARLLRVLENGEFIKVGSSKVIKTDVRVVAATNVNLMLKVEEGKFREDLYYRLSTVPIYVPPLRERGKDAELLFRKFAGDFAEKYKVKPIALTDDAKETLLKYRFPGNIRQLKNLVEQMSVLSTDNKEINSERLLQYLPQESSLPALYRSGSGSDSFSERDILYKVLFDMKKDMVDLKKLVLRAFSEGGNATQMLKENPELFEGLDSIPATESQLLDYNTVVPKVQEVPAEEEVHDITHETEDDSLLIEKKEKELIVRALQKNNNRRKNAARDLGISERTLYRKIKQYDLEE
ncbi:MAG TPA: sigma-54 dependent transcriptional regulator [Cyclobacteriaceae bacterium]|nr:sigma-54 dependent transcriptional regulator [Cyclobacteriaceae bacterium]HMV10518.1 sigma-54 dependent transcriptional regulator [Cyclobacteriaceae bacterium]HMV89961.1 sigma-54 dependent transcriptional regulator [Cyclobacteriaceae bacterium]HMX01811.1 sigma-54 dependent transcriptional regulator [Cyclobacteriaceae bacterium]HMX51558.1 sigma-54 dependent transcriptional regulator [Cyclobacteriaceae bacterium]